MITNNCDRLSLVVVVANNRAMICSDGDGKEADIANEVHPMQGGKKLCPPKKIVMSIKFYRHHVKEIL